MGYSCRPITMTIARGSIGHLKDALRSISSVELFIQAVIEEMTSRRRAMTDNQTTPPQRHGTELAITILGTLAVGGGLIFLSAWSGLNFVGFGGAMLMVAGVGHAGRLATRMIKRDA